MLQNVAEKKSRWTKTQASLDATTAKVFRNGNWWTYPSSRQPDETATRMAGHTAFLNYT